MKFWLGTHLPHWLRLTDMPLMVSNRTLSKMKTLPVALGPWFLDSGGFSELSLYGGWATNQDTYIRNARRYMNNIGNLQWAAPQDWMCEPQMLQKTGYTVLEHQMLTCNSIFTLREKAPDVPWIPVLQGYRIQEYHQHVEMYTKLGIDLTKEPLVGIGSVCRRQNTNEIEMILLSLQRGLGISLHGFGVKKGGIERSVEYLSSADSMAWSFLARSIRKPAYPECTTHINCANCLRFATDWREQLLTIPGVE